MNQLPRQIRQVCQNYRENQHDYNTKNSDNNCLHEASMLTKKKITLHYVIAFFTLAFWSLTSSLTLAPKMINNLERDVLPGEVKPIHYELVVRPDLEKFVFTGTVSIR